MKHSTIADVARKAQVSPASVSRYLNGTEGNLAPATAERIARVIQELGYRPNAWARSLKTRRSGLIAAVVADLSNTYVPAVLEGVETTINKAGLSLLVGNARNDPRQEELLIERLIDQRVEGLLLQPCSVRVSEALASILEQQIPVVLLDRILEGSGRPLNLVALDNAAALHQANDHLLGQGYRQLLYVTEPTREASSRRERETAVIENRNRWHSAEVFTYRDKRSIPLLRQIAQMRSSAVKEPLAILCSNSKTALFVVRSLSEAGIRVPQDVGLMTIDDPEWAAYVFGGITAIGQPTVELGRQGAQSLLAQMSRGTGRRPRQIRLGGLLKVRHSTSRS